MAKPPIPTPQIYARPRGVRLQWMCPYCKNLTARAQVDLRTARVRCTRDKCGRHFRVGFGFSQKLVNTPPYSAEHLGDYNGYTANKFEDPHDDFNHMAVGRVSGTLDWRCPACERTQQSAPEWSLGTMTCQGCGLVLYMRLLIYDAPRHHKKMTPHDWTFPIQAFVAHAGLALHDEAAGPGQ